MWNNKIFLFLLNSHSLWGRENSVWAKCGLGRNVEYTFWLFSHLQKVLDFTLGYCSNCISGQSSSTCYLQMKTVLQLGCVFLLHITFLLKCRVVIGFLFLQGGFYIHLCLYIYTHSLSSKMILQWGKRALSPKS